MPPPETLYRTSYEQNGFLIHPEPIFPTAVVEKAVEQIDAVRRGEYDTGRAPRDSPWKPGDDPNTLCKIEQPQFASFGLREILTYPALGHLAAEITKASMVQVWWVQLLYKPSTPPGLASNTSVGWHQDRSYWGVWEKDSELFTAWIGLSDVTEASGPMRFVSSSHKWGFRTESDFFEQNIDEQRKGIQVPEGEKWEEVAAIMLPGGVSFHDKLTFHGSGSNHSGSPRISLAVHMRTQNSRPVEDRRAGLTEFIDKHDLCPVIFRA